MAMDIARIYWRGVSEFGEAQADRYYENLMQKLNDIAESPYHYQVDAASGFGGEYLAKKTDRNKIRVEL